MGKFKFLVYGLGVHGKKKCTEKYDFYLSYNDWDNYGYRTSFILYDNKDNCLGHVSVFGRYELPNSRNGLVDFEAAYKILEELPQDYASIIHIDVYYKITQILPNFEDRREFARAMHIMSHWSYTEFRYYDSYQIGVKRMVNGQKDLVTKKHIDRLYERIFLADKNFKEFTNHGITINIKVDEFQKVCFETSRILWLNNQNYPSRFFYDIAMALYCHYEDIPNESYSIEPLDIAFNKVIFVSHMSFLNDYPIPKVPKELNQEETNLYCYVGIQNRFDLGWYDYDSDGPLTTNVLPIRTVNSIAEDLRDSFIREKIGYQWKDICEEYGEMFNDASLTAKMEQINTYRGTSMIWSDKNFGANDFNKIDYKHKIFIHTLGMILRNIQPYSIILIDRPDIFLDSKQLCFLLNKLSIVCEEMDSCVIINAKE